MSSTSEQQPTDTSGHDKPLLPEGYCIKGFVVQRMVGSGACSEVYQVQQQGTGAQVSRCAHAVNAIDCGGSNLLIGLPFEERVAADERPMHVDACMQLSTPCHPASTSIS